MAIYLIRHAQSLGNVNGRTESHASIPLTDLGHLQAQKLTELYLKQTGFLFQHLFGRV